MTTEHRWIIGIALLVVLVCSTIIAVMVGSPVFSVLLGAPLGQLAVHTVRRMCR